MSSREKEIQEYRDTGNLFIGWIGGIFTVVFIALICEIAKNG